MQFKFKHTDEAGQPVGFFSKSGQLLEDQLVLDQEQIPTVAIQKAHRVFGTLVLDVLDDQGQPMDVVVAVTGGDAETLSGWQPSPQCCCPYCESTVTLQGSPAPSFHTTIP